ncbi:simple sugar transport system substrate-binding protein [Agrobacterium larrymoorei]|uniref:Simple sugar transport system substrate-binding protein n=1 Tax=Agrobacterium larrymoorei TaxID=160699 RepID=A0AAJ2BMC6_9HYPH|nr:autoinducer 2 ABC transporter substrate-binding protein [Agrobacterium larrymoorei]MDR6102230.1 simple sugar transport system substrate-binding protein [Agrobacterium larrymoorei]
MRKSLILAGFLGLSLCAFSAQADEKPLFITVVKSTGFNWFKRMEVGVKEFGKENNVNAVQVGPSKADSAMQLQSLEDAISQKPKALMVVPLEAQSLEAALGKAKERGMIVVTHESADIKNADYDLEAFDNAAYGRHLMEEMAKRMNYEGQYAVFVGSLTQTTHNAWVDAAIALQKEKYPKMELVGTKNESHDDVAKAYQITKDLLKTYPKLKGIQGSDALDVVGAGQAVEEAGLGGKLSIVGTSIPSYAGDLIKAGTVSLITCWDPALAGEAMNKVALLISQGKKITDGMDLGVPGYEKITLSGKVIYGSAWLDMDKSNIDKYDF